jgi:hypothetical protein
MRDRPSDHHRRVLETKLGRKLKPSEVAHHADENKANNASANLSVQERSAHTTEHNRHRSLSRLRAALRMVREKRKSY